MTLGEVYRKKILYQTQIRRNHRQEKFKQLRYDTAISAQVNESWLAFLKQQPEEVPQICIQHFKYIRQDYLQGFLQLIMNNELQVVRPVPSLNSWFWNCVAANNLKFMTEIYTKQLEPLLAVFFKSTFQAYQPYYDFYIRIEKKIKYSGCYLNLISSEELSQEELSQRKIIQQMQSSEGSKAIVALLGFWGFYLSRTTQTIQISNFTMMLKLFSLFSQYSKIYYEKQTFRFLIAMLGYFDNMQIFSPEMENSINQMLIVMDCKVFLDSIIKRLPGVIKKHISYRIFYPEIGQILLIIQRLNKYKPGIFFQMIFHIELNNYLVGLLKKQREEQDYNECMMVGLRLLNYFNSNQNFYQVFYLQGAINITKILVHKLLFDANLQMVTAIVLYNLVMEDIDKYFLKIFELVDYSCLLEIVKEGTQVDIFEFLVRVLEAYHENNSIYHKLLVECELQQIMRSFYHNKEKKRGYEMLVKLVMRNLEFFMRQYRKVVEDMWHHAKEMTYDGQDVFLQKLEQFQQMRLSHMTL